jgi:hypothetical protein
VLPPLYAIKYVIIDYVPAAAADRQIIGPECLDDGSEIELRYPAIQVDVPQGNKIAALVPAVR